MLQPDKLNCSMRKQLRIAYATSKDLENYRIRGGPVILNLELKPNNKYVFERTSHMTFHTGVKPDKYHNFTMIWTSEQIALFVDGDKYGCIANNGQYTESYHIVLGVSAGGHLEYTETNSKPWSNGYSNATRVFHESFTGCCAGTVAKGECTQEINRSACSKNQKMECKPSEQRYVKRRCSKPWGPQSTMAIKCVRVYAV
ncbi:beta-1,3-glucan-binding protein-like [Rhagoletis pomonella]|uniref:beta-1,3-glucan-binding protein-like n=1 Tax=Rhagoletis pomonella TaxID=28610 RepID=UPI00177B6160|nr:beta-1,3-glucan-binding protein-like [Rhagoletis pomonella]